MALERPSRAIFIRPEIIRVVQETGAHPVCILRTLWLAGVRPQEATEAQIRSAADECMRKGMYVAVRKFLTVAPPRR